MRGINVPLSEAARQALIKLAEREWRDPRDQAAKLLTEALSSSGAMEIEPIQLTNGTRETVIA